MSDKAISPGDTEKALTGWHVLLIFLAFFGLMLSVNGVFLFHAITSFPGEDVKKSYLQGLNYNQTLAEREAQEALGWQASAGIEDGQLLFNLRDADLAPVSAKSIMVELRRATSDTADRAELMQANSGGVYAIDISDLAPGRWDARFHVTDARSNEVIFRAAKTVMVSP